MHCPESIRGCSRQPETTKCFELREQVVPRATFTSFSIRPGPTQTPSSSITRLWKPRAQDKALCPETDASEPSFMFGLSRRKKHGNPDFDHDHQFQPSKLAQLCLAFIFTIPAFVSKVGWRASSLFSVGRGPVFTEQTQHSAGRDKFSIPIPVQKPMSWDHHITSLGSIAQASAQMFSRDRETVQQMSVSSKMLWGAWLDSQVLSFPNQLITQRPQRGCD